MELDAQAAQPSAPVSPAAGFPASTPPAPPASALRRTHSASARATAQRLTLSPAASQHSNGDEDAEDERNRNGVVAPAPQSPCVSPSTSTSQQQQQLKQVTQQQMPSVQQNLQQLPQQGQPHQAQQQNSTQAATGNTAAPPGPTSSNEGRRISCEDIQLVQNLIERCLQLYMNRGEVITTLLNQAKIEPGFTGLVWQKLEEQNPEFFKAYYVRLKLKKQIMLFNHLLEQHALLTQKMHPIKAPLPSLQNGMHPSQVHHLPIGYPVPQQTPMTATSHAHIVSMPVASPSPPVLSAALVPEAFGAVHGSPVSNGVGDMDSEFSLLPTASSIPLSNDMSMGSSTVLPGNSTFPFTAMGNPADMSGIGMDVPANFPSDAPFHSSENHGQNGMGALQMTTDADVSVGRESLGILGHLPRNFSLSDLTAELTDSSDLLGNYTGSPFLTPDANGFIHSPDKEVIDDEKLLNDLTESMGYNSFEDEK